MVEIISHVEVNAPPERVWQLLMDFEHYPEWHPFVRLGGSAAEGAVISYANRWKPKSSRFVKSEATITRLDPNVHFGLKLGVPGLSWLDEWYALEATDSGTRLTHGVDTRGLLSLFVRLNRKRLTLYFQFPILNIARRFAKPAPKPAVPAKPVRKGGLRPPNIPRRRRH